MLCSIALAAVLLAGRSDALPNGLARTPQMGYNSWYDWMCDMDEKQLMATVDAFVDHGFVELGYTYFNLDDCWAHSRDADGALVADVAHFPSGTLKPLADYAHSKGMKFGTYTDRGPKTCAGRPAALGHEFQDAQTYADWGVDYLKEDSCNASGNHTTAFEEYGKMRDGLNKTGRAILFSLCGWNEWYAPVGQSLGNSWRIGPDDTNWNGVLTNININAKLGSFAGPGGWNDPCLLLAEDYKGDLRQTELQTRAQFSMWAIMASPLLISANIRNMSAMNLATYRNKPVIAVSQDPLGIQGVRLVGDDLNLGPSNSGGKPAHVAPCAAAVTNDEQWSTDMPVAGYLQNKGDGKRGTGLCINVDDCGADLIYFPCVTKGTTCSTNFSNMKFALTDGTLVSAMNKKCATVQTGGALTLTPCPGSGATVPPAQSFKGSADGRIIAGNGQCLTTAGSAPSPPGPQSANVWGRKLSDGYAMVFLNVGPAAADVACNAGCMAAAGFAASDTLSVHDLWSGATAPGTGAGIAMAAVPADGGVYMIKITKA